MEQFQDQTLTCADCHEPYIWRVRDQRFAEQNGWLPPKRCPSCRAAASQRREQRHAYRAADVRLNK
jgi:hypothetical protein